MQQRKSLRYRFEYKPVATDISLGKKVTEKSHNLYMCPSVCVCELLELWVNKQINNNINTDTSNKSKWKFIIKCFNIKKHHHWVLMKKMIGNKMYLSCSKYARVLYIMQTNLFWVFGCDVI